MKISQEYQFKAKYHFILLLLSCSLLAGLSACGSDDDDEDDGGSRVTSVNLDDNPISLGGETVLYTEFSFSSDDIFDDDQNVFVVVKLPNTVRYKAGTTEIDRPTGEDHGVDPRVTSCPNGETFLAFDLDEDDLASAANPDGDADARLNMVLVGTQLSLAATIEAAARNNNILYGCDQPFFSDAVTTIRIQ